MLGGHGLRGGRGERRGALQERAWAECACAGSHLRERPGCGRGRARPIWKTSDFVVVSPCPTTSPSLPHGAGHRSGVWAGPRPPPFLGSPSKCSFCAFSVSWKTHPETTLHTPQAAHLKRTLPETRTDYSVSFSPISCLLNFSLFLT